MSPIRTTRWCGIENISRINRDGRENLGLLDTGCQINTVTPRLVEALGLEVLPMEDLVGDQKKECIIGLVEALFNRKVMWL